jgi:hypothetical protein
MYQTTQQHFDGSEAFTNRALVWRFGAYFFPGQGLCLARLSPDHRLSEEFGVHRSIVLVLGSLLLSFTSHQKSKPAARPLGRATEASR